MAAELGDSLEAGRLKPCMSVWRCSEVGIWRPSSSSRRNGEGMRIPACHACVACIGHAWAAYAVMEMPIGGEMCSGKVLANSCRHMMADGDAMTRQDVLDESAWEMVWFAAQTRSCEHLSTLVGGDWVRAVERRRRPVLWASMLQPKQSSSGQAR